MHVRTRPLVMSCSAGLVLVGTFLPWVRVGTRSRSSYRLLGLIDRLEFGRGSLQVAAIRLWPVVPLLLVATCYASWLHRTRIAGVIGLVAAVYAGGLAVAVGRAPAATLSGVDLVRVGGIALLVASILHFVPSRVPESPAPGLPPPVSEAARPGTQP